MGHPDSHETDKGRPADPLAVAREIALRRLSTRAQTRHELAQSMVRKNVPDDIAEQVLDRFTEVGLIDDGAYAHAWVASRHGARHDSRRAIVMQLKQRGVDPELIDEATAEIDFDSEVSAARALAERRLRRLEGLPVVVVRRRLGGMLARKGYGTSVVMTVLRDLVVDEPFTELIADS